MCTLPGDKLTDSDAEGEASLFSAVRSRSFRSDKEKRSSFSKKKTKRKGARAAALQPRRGRVPAHAATAWFSSSGAKLARGVKFNFRFHYSGTMLNLLNSNIQGAAGEVSGP